MQEQDVKEVQETEHEGQEDTLKGLLPLSCLSTLTSCVCSDWTVRLVKVIPLHFLRLIGLCKMQVSTTFMPSYPQ